ncbi:hypothetical protein L1987_30474 [Smallanthus sonchifolius]|uniref:Uncharacterized protein n=1 Tax=Smallanthus sonchifolius TaxID=185202 RepID=A0ACB9I2A4_9ASTR|nr:hypothetical protein L1987_30474 [Smallanthus sonchifolius]
MMYNDPQQQQPPQPPQQQQMMHQFHQPQQMGEFQRGPLQQPPQMMRQPSASSTTLGGYQEYPQQHSHPPFDDNIAAKRMRKIGHRRAVDYTSTVVRYMQTCLWQQDSRDRTVLQPTPAVAIDANVTNSCLFR